MNHLSLELEIPRVALHVCTLSCVLLFSASYTAAHQAPLSMGFSRQEYWSGLPCSPPGDLPNPGIEPLLSIISMKYLRIYLFEFSQLQKRKRRFKFSFFLEASCFQVLKMFAHLKGFSCAHDASCLHYDRQHVNCTLLCKVSYFISMLDFPHLN